MEGDGKNAVAAKTEPTGKPEPAVKPAAPAASGTKKEAAKSEDPKVPAASKKLKESRKKKKKETKKDPADKAAVPAPAKEEAKKVAELPPIDPKVQQEWKTRMPELDHDYADALAEAVAFFDSPRLFTAVSAELEPLRAKYGGKLAGSEEEVEFSLTKLLAPLIEGSTGPLSEVIRECNDYLRTSVLGKSQQTATVLDKIAKLIPKIAQRKCFGIRKAEKGPAQSAGPVVASEESPKEALYCWEIENFNILELPNIKDIRARREQRKLLGQKVQKIWKFITTVKEARVLDDVKKLQDAEENYLKIKRREIAQRQKELDKKVKEEEKRAKDEQRKQLEEQKTKEAEERKRLKEEQRKLKEEQKAEEKKAKKRKHDELLASKAAAAEEAAAEPLRKSKEEEPPEEGKEAKKDPNQKMLTAFFSTIKVEGKPAEKTAKKPTVYTATDPVIPRFDFTKKVNIAEFEREIASNNPAVNKLSLMGLQIPPATKRTVKRHKKYIFVGDSDINRGDLYTFRSQIVTPRNPFAIDTCINYDLETDEEYEELVLRVLLAHG